MMKLTATVAVVAGLIVLSVVVAVKFFGTEPVTDNATALGLTDDDRNNPGDLRWEPGTDVVLDRNSQAIQIRSPTAESNRKQSESSDYIAGYQAGREAGLQAADEVELRVLENFRVAAERRAAELREAAAELHAVKEEFMEFDRNEYDSYDMDILRSLAEGMDSKAQIALAMRLLPPNQGANDDTEAEALELAKAASEFGEPMGAFLTAELLSRKEPLRAYSYLIRFEQRHGQNALVRRYIDVYPSIHRISAEELNRRVQWYLDNPNKSALDASISDLAPDHLSIN